MTGRDRKDISDILRQAQETKWPYARIHEFWETLPEPIRYGERMGHWLPDHDKVHNLLLDTLEQYLPPQAGLLDLGAGSGRVSQMILERFPECHVTLTDAAENMLNAATEKLAPFEGRYVIRHGDFYDDGFDFPAGSFEAILAVFSICHGRQQDHYARLYEKIQQWLKPGGIFLCLDHVLGATEAWTTLNVAGWWEYLAAHFSEEQVWAFILQTYQEDFPLSLDQHLQFLAAAGFQSSDVLYKRDIFAVYAALKAADGAMI